MPSLIYNDSPGTLPASYSVPPGASLQVESVSASFNGAGASGTFLACLAAYSQDGKLIGRWFPSQSFVAGDTGEVSYGPFLGDDAAGSGGATPVIGTASFAPVGGFQTIASTNVNAQDTIVTSPSFVADGLTTYRIDFTVALVDIGVTAGGTGAALILSLAVDTTSLGVIGDYNLNPVLNTYGSVPLFLSAFDTPAAGTHTYTVSAFKSFSGGAAATMRVYGSSAGPPFVGVTHPGYIAVYKIASGA